MKRNLSKALAALLALVMVLALLPTAAFATATPLTDLDALKGAFGEGAAVEVTGSGEEGNEAPFTVTITGKVDYPQDDAHDHLRIATEVILDLQPGAVLNMGSNKVVVVDKKTGDSDTYPSKLTIKGSGTITGSFSGKVVQVQNGASLTIEGGTITATGGDQIAVFAMNGNSTDTNLTITGGTFNGSVVATNSKTNVTIENGTFTATGRPAVNIQKGATATITGGTITKVSGGADDTKPTVEVGEGEDSDETKVTIKGNAVIDGDVAVFGKGNLTIEDSATITNTNGFAVSTNGSGKDKPNSSSGAKITLKGGTLTGSDDACGVYLPDGELTVEGGTISGGAGIVVRSGKLTVNGGSITATKTGTVTVGDAVNSNKQKYPVPAAGITFDGNGAYPKPADKATPVTVTAGSITGNPTVAYTNVGETATPSQENKPFDIKGGTFRGGNVAQDLTPYLAEDKIIAADGTVGDKPTSMLTLALADAVDQSPVGSAIESPVTNGKVVSTYDKATNTYNVQITATDVKYHLNKAENPADGYWIGLKITPENAEGAASYSVSYNGGSKNVPDTEFDSDHWLAVYYDVSKTKTDTIEVTFKDRDGRVIGSGTINVDLTGVKTDSMALAGAGFTYNVDNEQLKTANGGTLTKEDCGKETLYVKLDQKIGSGKYALAVFKDGVYQYTMADFGETPSDYSFLYWSYLTDQVPNTDLRKKGIPAGNYTFELYAYTGAKITDEAAIKYADGTLTYDGHNFTKLAGSASVNVTDTIATVEAKNAKATGGNNAVINATASVDGRTITISGSASNMGEATNITVDLILGNATDPITEKSNAGTVKVKIAPTNGDWSKAKVTVGDVESNTFKLLTKGGDFTVVSDLTVVDVEIADVGTSATVAEGVDSAIKKQADTIAENTTLGEGVEDVLQEKATEAVADPAVDTDPDNAADALNKAGVTDSSNGIVEASKVHLFVMPRVNLEINGYTEAEGGSKTLSMDISAVYDLVATTKDDAEDIDLDGTGSERKQNAVTIEKDQPLTVNESIELSVRLPKDFVSNTSTDVYVKHTKNGGSHYHKATVEGSSDYTAKIVSTDGLSPFVFEVGTKPAASIGTDNPTYYATLQEAVNAVKNGETITLVESCAEEVVVNREVTFTLSDSSSKFTGKIEAGSGYKLTKEGDNKYIVTVNSPSGGGLGGETAKVETATNGTVTLSSTTALAGSTVTITAKGNAGYVVDTVTVTDANGNTVSVKDNGDGTYTFTMPIATPVTVKATFKAAEKPSDTFTDLDPDAWYIDAVDFMVENKLMIGVDDGTKFDPTGLSTRGTVFTILARRAGVDTTGSDPWWQAGLDWAMANGVSDGTAQDREITRIELVTMLYRYANKPAADTSLLASFPDAADVPDWADAKEAMAWAVANGIITGRDNGGVVTLAPMANAQRVETAKIVMTFCDVTGK